MGFPMRSSSAGLARGLEVIDAACPLVTKVHNEGQRYAKKGYEIVLIGHEGHPEVEGTMGQDRCARASGLGYRGRARPRPG